jgi:hypothetical protein
MSKHFGASEQVKANDKFENVLPLKSRQCSPQWIYTHNHFGWRWIDTEDRWLPQLGEIVLRRGCNGVDANWNADLALTKARGKGYTVIMPDDKRLGKYQFYVYSHKAAGGKHYITEFDTLRKLGKQVVTDFDREGFHLFLAHLIDAGIVDPMDTFVLDKIVGRTKMRINRLSNLAIGNPHAAGKIGVYEEQVKRMRAAWDRQFGEDKDASSAMEAHENTINHVGK